MKLHLKPSIEHLIERRVEPLKLRFARSIRLKSMSGEWKREREERGEVPEDPVKTTLANTIVHCVRKRHFMFLFRPPSTKGQVRLHLNSNIAFTLSVIKATMAWKDERPLQRQRKVKCFLTACIVKKCLTLVCSRSAQLKGLLAASLCL